MNELMIFNNPEFGQVRAIERDGAPWFVAADVCAALGVGNSSQAIARLDDDEKGVILNDTPGGAQKISIVSEPGLYTLVLGSRKKEAKTFKRWITHDVVPSIRKNGGYIQTTPEMTPEEIMAKALLLANATIENQKAKLGELASKNSVLTVQNQIMQPKAEYFDELVERNTLTNFRETAKELGVPPKKFTTFLLDKKYLYRDKKGKLLPYEHKNDGLFEVKETFNEKTQWSGTQTLVTPKGRETFRLLMIA